MQRRAVDARRGEVAGVVGVVAVRGVVGGDVGGVGGDGDGRGEGHLLPAAGGLAGEGAPWRAACRGGPEAADVGAGVAGCPCRSGCR